MSIKHTELQLGPITLLSRPNAGGWTWVHFAGVDSNEYNIQNVHMSRLRTNEGISEILAVTSDLPVLGLDASDYIAARQIAAAKGLCTV